MMRFLILVLATAIIFVASPVFAADTQNTQNTPASDANRIVCKSAAPETGTRIGSRRVCMTQREWDDQHQEAQKLLDTKDTGSFSPGSGH